MTCVAVLQPSYLPWLGYFDLLDRADCFVLLDTAPFARRSWQQRNRLRSATGFACLGVPVRARRNVQQSLDQVALAGDTFVADHLRALAEHYRQAPGFELAVAPLADAMLTGAATGRLALLNERLVITIAALLGIETPILRASSLGLRPEDGRLPELLRHVLGATACLTAPGAVDRLCDSTRAFSDAGLELWLQQYDHPRYAQLHEPFMPFASVVDAIFCLGPEAALELLRQGRRAPHVRVAPTLTPSPQPTLVA